MKVDNRLLVSAIAVAAFALVMFSAAGFFYSSLQEVLRACSQYTYSDCLASESIRASSISLRVGTAIFFTTGSVAWMTAAYVAFKWKQMGTVGRLP